MAVTHPLDDVFRQAAADHFAGRWYAAEPAYRRILAAAPNHAECLHLLGILLHQTERSTQGIPLLRRAIRLQPKVAQYRNNLGNVLRDSGDAAGALACYQAALRIDPNLADLHHNMAKALVALGRDAEAEQAWQRALSLQPAHVDARNDLGTLLTRLGRSEEAVSCFGTLLRSQPNDARALNNLGSALIGTANFDAAVDSFRAALRIQPDYGNAWYNLGRALAARRDWDGALEAYQEAAGHVPDDAEIQFGHASLLLSLGRLEEGWPRYESWVHRVTGADLDLTPPPRNWNGEDIGPQTLVLYADQGLGDAVQFARYIPRCVGLARVVLAVPPALRRLLGTIDGIAGVLDKPVMPVNARHCPLASLPNVFGTTLSSIPAGVPYLKADPRRSAIYRERLAALGGLSVGLVWRGNPKFKADLLRSLRIAQLAPLGTVPGVTFVSLQRDVDAAERETVAETLHLHDWMDEVEDLADTAAIIAALDLVIGVDTGLIHLAGALGRPVWLLNRFETDWRWLLDRDDSPWYPTMRLFRQPKWGEWDTPIQRAKEALAALTAAR